MSERQLNASWTHGEKTKEEEEEEDTDPDDVVGVQQLRQRILWCIRPRQGRDRREGRRTGRATPTHQSQ